MIRLPAHAFAPFGCRGRRLEDGDLPAVLELLGRCRDYVELAHGREPTAEDAVALLRSLPPAHVPDDKLLVGFFANSGGELVGVLDVLRDYPEAETWFLGLLLFAPEQRGRRFGEQVYGRLEEWLIAQGARAVHLGVLENNPDALRFWERCGFTIEETRDAHDPSIRARVHYMVRDLEEEPASS
jgi:ribosomal protein S18 acetylase RimI-like enzyme